VKRARFLGANNLEKSIELAHQKSRLHAFWGRLAIEEVQADTAKPLAVRDKLSIGVVVNLGELKPEELRVQVYSGTLDNDGRINQGHATDLQCEKPLGNGRYRFTAEVDPQSSGQHGFAVRIIPGGSIFEGIHEPGLVCWEKSAAPANASVTPAPATTAA
jgi:starch phosphorylase